MIPTMIVIGAAVAWFTRWPWAVVVGAIAWPAILVFVPDLTLRDLPLGAALGAANAAVGGALGVGIRRLSVRLEPAR